MKAERVTDYAQKVIDLAHDTIMIRYRYFDVPLAKLVPKQQENTGIYEVTRERLMYDPKRLLSDYMDEKNYAVRLYMHVIFHELFLHPYKLKKDKRELWNLATDIAVENVILEMGDLGANLSRDDEERMEIDNLKKKIDILTAEKIYKYFEELNMTNDRYSHLQALFEIDKHSTYDPDENEPEYIIGLEDWKRIARRVLTEKTRFSRQEEGTSSLSANLNDAAIDKKSYEDVLRQFAVWGEEIKVNPDEFDYVYYTYGLRQYNNMPLIEPLEYTEDKRIREFVVVIDTSASCSNAQIQGFLKKTYDILSSTENFSRKINVHVLAADAEVKWDKKVSSIEEMAELATHFELTGQGATDFRPAFEYTDTLIKQKELENLRGLIYFTDGYGIYPEYCPTYGVVFAFTDEDANKPKVPDWAIEVVL